ncbi:hypothetical protein GJAV_G00268350 [Gymnothorax javanicus]|nr:hypothetical protein GJAV_G00268350 [Gymnothorax javanicus]
MTCFKETWKVFLAKVSGVLDEALIIFSNMSTHITSLSASHFLDIVGELRINDIDDEQLADVNFINQWFHGNLRPFLSSVSGEFLRCLATKNFSCETYQEVVKAFSSQFLQMNQMRQELVARYFLLPFLSRNTSDPSCISNTSGSLDWLQKNLGEFSVFVPLADLQTLNADFDPLAALPALSAEQMAELVASSEYGPHPEDLIINTVFDYLLDSPKQLNLPEFLYHLMSFSAEKSFSCNASNIIFRRLDLALPSTPPELEPVIRDSMNTLLLRAPDCISGDFGCPVTLYNKTGVCATVNSTELKHYLYTANMTDMLCHFSIGQHACSSIMEFTAENLAMLLQCKLPSNMTCSKETWKMFLTNVSGILDEALHILSNMSHFTSLSASHFLDILGELRIDEFSDEQLADVDFINMWFHGNLRPFLSSVTGELLQCLGTKNFSCEAYQEVLKAFNFQFTQMDRMQSELVYKYFILPILLKNTSDPACVSSSNGSLDWLHKNFGGFSVLVSLQTLQKLNPYFSPLETLPVLSAKQVAELVVFTQTEPSEKEVIVNAVFDHLQESSYTFKEFLHFLIMFSRETMIECFEYKIIFLRLYQALPLVPQDLEPDIWATINELMKTAPGDHCLPDVPGCSFIPHNETRVCAGINSSELQHYLNTGIESEELCRFDIEQYACSSLINFTAERLVSLLKCKLPSNTACSIETWKVFLTKVSGVLNEALNIFSNMSFHITSPSTSHFLEVLGEIRIDRFSDVQVADVDFISTWFQGYLRPFLSSVSGEFLHCLTTKSFSCETYQQVVMEFSFQFHLMDPMRRELVSKYFILPFLSRNTSDPACVSTTNGTTDWMHKNFGPFSVLIPVRILMELSQDFDALEALPFLSAKQMAEVVVFLEAASSQNEVIINTVFDLLLESQDMAAFKEFLHYLNLFSSEGMISCDSYKSIFSRLYLALPMTPDKVEPNIWASINELMKTAPGDCMPDVTGCSLTQHNETRLCSDVNSSELQQYLNFGNKTEKLCHFDIEQYACSSLIHFTAEDLVNLLKCKLIGNMTYSKETWKLFLIKAIGVLNEALSILSNMSYHLTSPSATHFLEILGEIRIDRFSGVQLADRDFINKWFHGYLSPFLSSVSEEFLHCLNTKNLSCETYQQVVMGFSFQFSNMTQSHLVLENFILPFLTRNTSDPACVSGTNGSTDWLLKNLGPFSVLLPLETLQILNQDFDPLEALPLLSAKQAAELVLFSQTGLTQEIIIDKVFEHLLESPEKKNLHEFLEHLVMLSPMANISCDSYNEIFNQLTQALSMVPTEMVLTITSCIEKLMAIAPQDCTKVVFSEECDMTPVNETALCAGVNRSDLQRRIMDGSITETLCSFSIEQYACVLPIGLTAQHLARLLQCKLNNNVTISKETWKLFLSKVSRILDEALNLLSGMMASSRTESTSHVLDVIGEIRFGGFTEELSDIDFVNEWFQIKLKPFLPSVSKEFLSCLSMKNFSCPTYQAVVKILGQHCAKMDKHQKILIFTDFIDVFLSKNDTTDPGCISSTNGSADWLERNFRSFIEFASLMDFQD